MLDIFHKLPGAAKKFLETQGEVPLMQELQMFVCSPTHFTVVTLLRCYEHYRRTAGHSCAHHWPGGVAAQAARGRDPIQTVVTVPVTADSLSEPLPGGEVRAVWERTCSHLRLRSCTASSFAGPLAPCAF